MKNWLKISIVLIVFALLSISIYFTLKLCGFSNFEQIQNLIENTKHYSMTIFILIFTSALILLCFVPLCNTSFLVLAISLFGPVNAFIVCMISNFISSSILFFIGDKFGEKFAIKLVGKKDFERAQNLIDGKSKIIIPLLYIIPFFPDESLCIVAGMTKMKYWYLILINTLYHAIEVGLFCILGSELINWNSLSVLDWFTLINIVIIDVIFLLKLEKYIQNKKK